MINEINESKSFHDDIIGKPPRYITRIGISFIAIFIVVVLIFAWLIDYSDSINARIQINSLHPTITVKSNRNGVVNTVFKKNGQYVHQGDNVILLDSETDIQILSNLKKILSNNLKNNDIQMENSQKSLGFLRKDYKILIKLINQYQHLKDNSLLQLKINKLKLENKSLSMKLNDLIKHKILYNQKRIIAESEYKRTLKLKKNNLLSIKDLDSSMSKLIDRKILFANIQVSINDIQSQLSVNKNNIKILITENTNTLAQLSDNIYSQKLLMLDLIHSWETKHLYKANISGIVSIPNNIFNYQNININQDLFSIIPKSNTLIGKIKIPEKGVGKVKIGQTVSIKLDSYPFQEFGEISGEVFNKSSSIHESYVFIDVTIKANIGTDNTVRTSYGKLINYIPNMQGQVEIITQRKNILSRIFENLLTKL